MCKESVLHQLCCLMHLLWQASWRALDGYSAFPVESHTCIRSEFIMKCQSLSEVPKKREELLFQKSLPKRCDDQLLCLWNCISSLIFVNKEGCRPNAQLPNPYLVTLGWPLLEDLPLQVISRLVISQPFLGISHSWRPRFLKLFSSGALESCESLYRCLRLNCKVMNFSEL